MIWNKILGNQKIAKVDNLQNIEDRVRATLVTLTILNGMVDISNPYHWYKRHNETLHKSPQKMLY